MKEQDKRERIAYAEYLLVKSGAAPTDIKPRGQGEKENRHIYILNDDFYRIGEATFEGIDDPYIVVSCTDTKKYAEYGLFDDIHAFEFTLSNEEMEKEIRFALGIDELFTS
ncbi:MAG: hypothetical protein IJ260_03570 [Butyrivibrio sp.]|nr:hypothetical protein [Butyrivibrio sp.]MBQ8030600.1 hypothetical protein [Butyrivibrio sp.]MBR1641111.1 hypothetical protein [Butyrivibrio sp.]